MHVKKIMHYVYYLSRCLPRCRRPAQLHAISDLLGESPRYLCYIGIGVFHQHLRCFYILIDGFRKGLGRFNATIDVADNAGDTVCNFQGPGAVIRRSS